MLNLDISFLDIDVRRTVFTHRAELDQMTIGLEFLNREQHVQRSDNVVHLRKYGVLAIDHRIGRGALFGEMDHSVRLKVFKHRRQKVVIRYVANEQFDGLSRQFLPDADAIGQGLDGRQSLYAKLKIPLPPQKVVDDGDVVARSEERRVGKECRSRWWPY